MTKTQYMEFLNRPKNFIKLNFLLCYDHSAGPVVMSPSLKPENVTCAGWSGLLNLSQASDRCTSHDAGILAGGTE